MPKLDLFAAFGRGDKQAMLTLSAEDIEWIDTQAMARASEMPTNPI
jgi:ketosteroid isomerase-like protein